MQVDGREDDHSSVKLQVKSPERGKSWKAGVAGAELIGGN